MSTEDEYTLTYDIAKGGGSDDLVVAVNTLIREGFVPSGNAYLDEHGTHYQPMWKSVLTPKIG